MTLNQKLSEALALNQLLQHKIGGLAKRVQAERSGQADPGLVKFEHALAAALDAHVRQEVDLREALGRG